MVHDEREWQVDEREVPTGHAVQREVDDFKYCPTVHFLEELQDEEDVLPAQLYLLLVSKLEQLEQEYFPVAVLHFLYLLAPQGDIATVQGMGATGEMHKTRSKKISENVCMSCPQNNKQGRGARKQGLHREKRMERRWENASSASR